ncbi:MAG TPA: hypothetical protein VFD46_13535, partial [Chryseolinea sp.]|nr:hypothetical protein [Chryseolinea sp.]
MSNLRIATAVLVIASIYFGFSNNLLFISSVLLIIIFIYQVIVHSRLYDEKIHLENLVKINLSEKEALTG